MPEDFSAYRRGWMEAHPNWAFPLWGDRHVDRFLPEGTALRGWFDREPKYAQKSDILRYCVLREYGGVYLDTDFECVGSLDSLPLDALEAFTAEEAPGLYCNAVIGSEPGGIFVSSLVDLLDGYLKSGGKDTAPTWRTGPVYMTKVADEVGHVEVYPRELFFPYYYNEKHRRGETFEGAIGIHHWQHSWA